MAKPSQPVRGGGWGTKNTGKSGNTGVLPLGATQVFLLLFSCLGLARKIGVPPRNQPGETSDTAGRRSLPNYPQSSTRSPQPPSSLTEALGTGEIPADLSLILADRFWKVCGDGAALSSEKHSGQGLQYFLDELDSGVDPIPVLEQVKLVGVDLDIMVHLMHSLLPYTRPSDVSLPAWEICPPRSPP